MNSPTESRGREGRDSLPDGGYLWGTKQEQIYVLVSRLVHSNWKRKMDNPQLSYTV